MSANVDHLTSLSPAVSALLSPIELTASVTDWIGDREDEAWSDGVSDLVQSIARDVPR